MSPWILAYFLIGAVGFSFLAAVAFAWDGACDVDEAIGIAITCIVTWPSLILGALLLLLLVNIGSWAKRRSR